MTSKFKFTASFKKIVADVITPVSTYLKIRDQFPNSILLESSDYHSAENSYSFICIHPISQFKVNNQQLTVTYPNQEIQKTSLTQPNQALQQLEQFIACFEPEQNNLPFAAQGLFGYTAFDALPYFDKFEPIVKKENTEIPEIFYQFFECCIAINHFKNEAYLIKYDFDFEIPNAVSLEHLESIIQTQTFATYPFQKSGAIASNLTDDSFKNKVNQAIAHCKKGDVFQLVISRQFQQQFTGDEFNVYRALRSINPSPYLFYFDFGNFKILGSSPEAQLVVKNNKAEIHPIAGTFKRTGNDEEDALLAKQLSEDPKENAEHIMLVDLARNDLSRNGKQVTVETLKQIHFYSHVIHLVSKVTAVLKNKDKALQTFVDTFPAGTLSGAPKFKAIQLIQEIENCNRSFYGGAIGYIDFNGNLNHAIMIRSFLSKNHTLTFQAGAGVVESSNPENENQEVFNKLQALAQALNLAENI
ncbi:anthranilate synthase component I family protein [Flavobacterium agricola]|uniref:Anthranilate synthase component 1 n=1 Tax=Flavobacterium agricola TaxID=2870839 RepID=A0ABY6M1L1_9FLAO|nr:anthranilate synthase component I family protein [Flavobacterium agricola]UYW01605.1 anthranilate synthase component I family protein [Flavobacterium agricola]